MLQKVPKADREVVARLRNCILALAASKIPLYSTSILHAYEESEKYQVKQNIFVNRNCTYLQPLVID